jgi:hypothetical protein
MLPLPFLHDLTIALPDDGSLDTALTDQPFEGRASFSQRGLLDASEQAGEIIDADHCHDFNS